MGRAGRTGGCDCAGHGLDAGRGHRQQLDKEPRHAVRLVLRLSRRRLEGDGDGVLRVPRLRRDRPRPRGRRRTHSGRHRRRRARLRPASETLHVTRIFPRAPDRPRAAARPQARLRRPDRHRQDDRAVGRVSVDRRRGASRRHDRFGTVAPEHLPLAHPREPPRGDARSLLPRRLRRPRDAKLVHRRVVDRPPRRSPPLSRRASGVRGDVLARPARRSGPAFARFGTGARVRLGRALFGRLQHGPVRRALAGQQRRRDRHGPAGGGRLRRHLAGLFARRAPGAGRRRDGWAHLHRLDARGLSRRRRGRHRRIFLRHARRLRRTLGARRQDARRDVR